MGDDLIVNPVKDQVSVLLESIISCSIMLLIVVQEVELDNSGYWGESELVIMCTRLLNHSNNVAIVMVEGEAEGIDETTFCEAVMMGMSSVSVMMCGYYGSITWQVQPMLSAIKRFSDEFGKVKRSFQPFIPPDYVEHHME